MESSGARRVEEVMLREVVTAPRNASLSQAQGLMRSGRLRHLVIVEEGIVVGLLSHRVLLEAALATLRENLGPGSAKMLDTITIEHLLREPPLTVSPECALETAANHMLALRIGCLPVATPSTRGPRLEGLVTEAGLLRAAYLPPPPRA